MSFSRLFVILLLAGIGVVGAASFFGLELHAFFIYNILLFGAWVLDLVLTPGKKRLEVSRISSEKLSMGIENTIDISIRNNSGYMLNATIKDTIPAHFNIVKREAALKISPKNDNMGSYIVIPQKRGEFTFGGIYIKLKGVAGLSTKVLYYDLKDSLKVYPNIKDLRKFSLAYIEKARLSSGMKRSKAYGAGTEFESLKEYTEGADYRKINWMATARAGKLIVNTYQPERNQQIYILMDCSRVMNSEINGIKKLDYSINAAFLLADVAIRKGDNTGLLVFDNLVRRFVMPGKGQGQFNLLATNLYNVEEKLVTADYGNTFRYLNERQKRRCLLCIFTELFDASEALELVKTLKSTAVRHIPLIITIKDQRLEEAVTEPVKDSSQAYMKGAALKLLKERENIRRIFSQSGIASIDVPPDKLTIEVINKYLTMKAVQAI